LFHDLLGVLVDGGEELDCCFGVGLDGVPERVEDLEVILFCGFSSLHP